MRPWLLAVPSKSPFRRRLGRWRTEPLASPWKHINEDNLPDKATLLANIRKANAERVFHLRLALVAGIPIEELYATTGIDPWFLHQLLQIVELEKLLREQQVDTLDGDLLRRAKEWGFQTPTQPPFELHYQRSPRPPPTLRRGYSVQASRYLRCRV